MVYDVAVEGGPEVAELADVGHLAGVVETLHVLSQSLLRVVVLLTDTANQRVGVALVNLKSIITIVSKISNPVFDCIA